MYTSGKPYTRYDNINLKLYVISAQITFITSRACPGGFNDPEELLPMCYKCSNYSSHLRGNRCPTCQQDYVFSYVSFGKISTYTNLI